MQIEIKNKKENKLLGRLEIEGKISFDKVTTSNAVLGEKLAVDFKADKELVVVKHIYSKFSLREADFLAYIYHDKKTLQKMEITTKYMKKKAEEKKKKEAEEKKTEA